MHGTAFAGKAQTARTGELGERFATRNGGADELTLGNGIGPTRTFCANANDESNRTARVTFFMEDLLT